MFLVEVLFIDSAEGTSSPVVPTRTYSVRYGDMFVGTSVWQWQASAKIFEGVISFMVKGYDKFGNLVKGTARSLKAGEDFTAKACGPFDTNTGIATNTEVRRCKLTSA